MPYTYVGKLEGGGGGAGGFLKLDASNGPLTGTLGILGPSRSVIAQPTGVAHSAVLAVASGGVVLRFGKNAAGDPGTPGAGVNIGVDNVQLTIGTTAAIEARANEIIARAKINIVGDVNVGEVFRAVRATIGGLAIGAAGTGSVNIQRLDATGTANGATLSLTPTQAVVEPQLLANNVLQQAGSVEFKSVRTGTTGMRIAHSGSKWSSWRKTDGARRRRHHRASVVRRQSCDAERHQHRQVL